MDRPLAADESADASATPQDRFEGPLFLVGMPRSGTKLLRDLLNQHSRIAIPGVETEFLPWLAHHVDAFGDLSQRGAFDRLYRKLARGSFFSYGAQRGAVVDARAWQDACASYDAAGIFEGLVRSSLAVPRGSDRIWGDKSPSYIDDLPLIADLYPEARVLHLVRDVRDHCVSMHRAWGKDMRRAAYRWAQGVTQARRDSAALLGRYMEVRYEELLRDPEATLRGACGFLGLAFEPAMLTLPRPSENLGDTRGARHVVSGNLGKYAGGMAGPMLADVEQIAADAMREFGYEPALPFKARQLAMMPLRLRWAQLRDAVQLVRHRARDQGLLEALSFHVRYFLTTRG